MNLIDLSLTPVRRLMHGSTGETCFVCRKPILSTEARMRLRHDTVVHRSCATYRVRKNGTPGSRLGYPG